MAGAALARHVIGACGPLARDVIGLADPSPANFGWKTPWEGTIYPKFGSLFCQGVPGSALACHVIGACGALPSPAM